MVYMKRILHFILPLSAVFLWGCVMDDLRSGNDKRNEISFVTVHAPTKTGITGTVFPTDQSFSVYAWADGSVGAYFMDNETVSYDSAKDKWKASGTYYWPKNQTVDFQCYYPAGMSGINIGKTQIKYTGIDVATLQKDIMYSDKSVGYTENVDEVDNGVPGGYSGVPVIFRHALAKVKVLVNLVYNHKAEDDGTVTDWSVNVNSAVISGILPKGDCTLNLSDTGALGTVAWDKPADPLGYHVWTADPAAAPVSTKNSLSGEAVVPGTPLEAVAEFFVLPQSLSAGGQKITLNLSILTKRNGADFLNETFDISTDLYLAVLPAWQMNQVTTYKIDLSPTASNGNGGKPVDPDNPVNPSNPDLSDAIITFDPAIDGWDNVGVETIIYI